MRLLRPAEAALNRGIGASSTAQAALLRVGGRVLTLEFTDLALSVGVAATDVRLRLEGEPAGQPDACIKGSVLAFLGMLAGAESGPRIGRIIIEGDADVAEQFRELLRLALPDPEEELSRLVGDILAHQLGRAVRGATAWGRRSLETLGANLSEYLQEESRSVVPRAELDEFAGEVDRLREAVDRLDARVRKLG